jgi:phosphate transport system substrate-binding protein
MRWNMKKITLLFFVLLTANQLFAQKFKIRGSDTELPLTQNEAEEYMKRNKNANLMVTGGGSGVGLSALLNGTTDIAQASRSLRMDEKLKLKNEGKAYKEVIIAYDAIAVIVHPSNKVSQLTREQLEAIYTGKITNWKDVGGENLKIVIYSRETSSGTYEFFKEHVLNKKNYTPTALLMPATGAIVQSVSQTRGAIGYIGLGYLEKTVKALKVSYDNGATFVAPSVAAAKNNTYPISRPLYYYYLSSIENTVSPYIKFVLSNTGQQIVLKTGYVPIR